MTVACSGRTPVIAIVLALGASVSYGVTDFLGGLASRKISVFLLGAFTQPLGLVLLFSLSPSPGARFLNPHSFGEGSQALAVQSDM